MAKFLPGQSGNPAGRPKSTKNVVPADLRQRLRFFMDGKFDGVNAAFDRLDDAQKVQYYIRLLPYVVPALKESDVRLTVDSMTDDQLHQVIDEILAINQDEEN